MKLFGDLKTNESLLLADVDEKRQNKIGSSMNYFCKTCSTLCLEKGEILDFVEWSKKNHGANFVESGELICKPSQLESSKEGKIDARKTIYFKVLSSKKRQKAVVFSPGGANAK